MFNPTLRSVSLVSLVSLAVISPLSADIPVLKPEVLHAVSEDGRLMKVEGLDNGPIAVALLETSVSFADLAIDGSGRILASGISASGPAMYELDPALGSTTMIFTTATLQTALAFDVSGRLWGLGSDAVLRRFDPQSGLVVKSTALGATPLAEGLTLAPDGMLYLSDGDTVKTVDPDTGDVTDVAMLSLPVAALSVRGLEFDEQGTLFAIADALSAPSLLLKVDMNSGATELLGPVHGTNGLSLSGISFKDSTGIGMPGLGLGKNHDLILSWTGGVLLGSAAESWAPGLLVAGLEEAISKQDGFSFLVNPNSAAMIPIPVDGNGQFLVPVSAALLSSISTINVQLLTLQNSEIHASNRAVINGGLGGVDT